MRATGKTYRQTAPRTPRRQRVGEYPGERKDSVAPRCECTGAYQLAAYQLAKRLGYLQRILLEAEGVVFDDSGKIRLRDDQWKPKTSGEK